LNRILVYILVFYLVYFVATIVLNKTLKITKNIIFKATKSLVVVVTICFCIYAFFSLQIYRIPSAEKLAYVEINSDMGFDYVTSLYGGLVITNQDDIQKVIDLNKKILKSKYSQNDGRIVFKYVYKGENPKVLIRSFQQRLLVTVEDSENLNYHLTEGEFSDDVKGLTSDESFIEAILDTLVIDYDSEYYTLETSYLHNKKDKLNYQVPYTEEFNKIFREEAKIYIQEHGTFYDISNSITSGDSLFGEFNVDTTRLRIRFSNVRSYSRQFRLVDGYFDKTINYIKDNSPAK